MYNPPIIKIIYSDNGNTYEVEDIHYRLKSNGDGTSTPVKLSKEHLIHIKEYRKLTKELSNI